MNAEIKEKRWLFAGLGIQLAVGFSLSFITYFFGTLFSGIGFKHAWMPIAGWCVVIASALIFTLAIIKKRIEVKANRIAKEKVAV